MTTENALKLASLAIQTVESIIVAMAKAKGGEVDVSALNIPASYYDDMRRLGATEEEIEDLKQ